MHHEDEIRFLRLDRCYEDHRVAYAEAHDRVLASGNVVGGEQCEKLESRLAKGCSRKNAILVPSGTTALQISALSLGIDPSWRIIVPAYTFLATATSLKPLAGEVVAVDVDDHYQMDVRELDGLLRIDRPTLVVAVGLFGDGLDDEALVDVVGDRATMIEDGAQSFETLHTNRPGGDLGTLSTLSFSPTKITPSFGNLGAVLTCDDELAARARAFRRHGKRTPDMPAIGPGLNAVPNALQASQVLHLLEHAAPRRQRREDVARSYIEAIEGSRGILPPPRRPNTRHAWHKFVIRHTRRNDLIRHLQAHGIQTQIHYPLSIDQEIHVVGIDQDTCPNARRLASESVSLPLYPELLDEEVGRVCTALRTFLA
ncbi:DegT/DnrJ/EryC1/StrS family aminotransferase [bacterium]|nr:DegT/DnrJ/EryC1/StrS family aminotransferase [bacterium]